MHPQPRAQSVGSTRVSSPRSHRDHPAFPHAMVLTVSFALSPVIGLSCHRRPADMVLSAPGRADKPPLDLTPASRRQDHTTSPSACAPFVKSAPASTASRTHVRDDRETPLVGTGWVGYRFDLGQARSELFLRRGLDRKFAEQPVGQITGRTIRRDIACPRTWALNDDRIIDVRFAAHYGFNSEITPGPLFAKQRTHAPQQSATKFDSPFGA